MSDQIVSLQVGATCRALSSVLFPQALGEGRFPFFLSYFPYISEVEFFGVLISTCSQILV